MEVSEIKTLMTDLEKASAVDRILEILDTFDKEVKPTEKLLKETKLGIAVNKLRSHKDGKISEKVKKIIKKWKDEVIAQKSKKRDTAKSALSQPAGRETESPVEATTQAAAAKRFTSNGPRNPKNDGVRTDVHGDSVRDKCLELTYTALAVDSEAFPADILEVAKTVEHTVYKGEKGTTAGYKTKMRSLYMNLKDPKNPSLRKRVLGGEISAQRLYTMTPQEMASDELQKEINELKEQNLFKAQGAKEKRATTDRFTCGKCKHKKVSYYQMQTRSADEPLTTFCTCEHCGNRWKFS